DDGASVGDVLYGDWAKLSGWSWWMVMREDWICGMTSLSLPSVAAIAILAISVGGLAGYLVGFAAGRREGFEQGKSAGKEEGKREASIKAFAAGYERGKLRAQETGGDKGSSPAKGGCLPIALLLLLLLVGSTLL